MTGKKINCEILHLNTILKLTRENIKTNKKEFLFSLKINVFLRVIKSQNCMCLIPVVLHCLESI